MKWDYEFDFAVVGSGAGGMAGALMAQDLGLKTVVLEKSQYYGGTTALSGGVIWVPDNHLMPATGIADSIADGVAYLQQVTRGEVNEERLRAYVIHAAEMVEYLEKYSHVRFEAAEKYCDYYPELQGGKLGARSLDPLPFSRKKLADQVQFIQPINWKGVLNRFSLTAKESHFVLEVNYKTYLFIAYRLLLHYLDLPSRLKGLPNDRSTLGQALVGRLRRSLMDREVPLWLKTNVEELLTEHGRIVGLRVIREGKVIRIRVNKGVLMASGGFAQNEAMRREYQRAPIGSEWTAANDLDLGDGIRMGMAVGADLEFMDCAWWTPVVKLPDNSVWPLIVGKAMPGSIFVNGAGQRFTNEAAPYEDVVKGQYHSNERGEKAIPCFMLFDKRYRHNYTVATLPPAKVQPDEKIPQEFVRAGFLKRGETLAELAAQIGVDAVNLEATVLSFNEAARRGIDSAFGRGESASDRYYSDPKHSPNPCLAPLDQPPYYAIAIYPGDLGTKGGLKCDQFARVLNKRGEVLRGLYATGNCSGAVMGDSYPGAGSTIGPAMTFAYIAAKHAAGAFSPPLSERTPQREVTPLPE